MHLTNKDVVLGRGNDIKDSDGSAKFRTCGDGLLAEYNNAGSTNGRKNVAEKFYRAVINYGGRFLEKVGDTYVVIEEERAINKCSAYFRSVKNKPRREERVSSKREHAREATAKKKKRNGTAEEAQQSSPSDSGEIASRVQETTRFEREEDTVAPSLDQLDDFDFESTFLTATDGVTSAPCSVEDLRRLLANM